MNDFIKDKDIFLMPFTPNSILIYYLLKQNGVKIQGFCDNDSNLASKSFEGNLISSPSDAFDRSHNAMVILSEMLFYDNNEEQLRKLGFNDIVKMDELSFDENLEDFIPIMCEDTYSTLIPSQAPNVKYLMRSMASLKSWDALINEVRSQFIKPYSFKEKDIVTNISNGYAPHFLVCVNASDYCNKDFFAQCVDSISVQRYCRFTPLFILAQNNTDVVEQEIRTAGLSGAVYLTAQAPMQNIETVKFARERFADFKKYDLVITIGANDKFSSNALAVFANEIYNRRTYTVYTANEDRICNDEYIAPYYKQDYQEHKLIDTVGLVRNLVCIRSEFCDNGSDLNTDDICVIDEILYHYRVFNDIVYDNSIKPIAFYLPQFHTIPENDRWWGEGFTEWTNVKRAVPMFDGHYQPHVPAELGYYDLVEDKSIQKKQMDLAKEYGIYGFCYYYYWFNGKRLLEKPLNHILNNPDLDMPFCICWANENWTRRWDGLEQEVLMGQAHNDDSDRQFILDVLPILKDSRYITVNGAPLLLVYRYDLFPDFRKTVKLWREIAALNNLPNLHVSVVKTTRYSDNDFAGFGCDSETDFPPWRTWVGRIRDLAGLTPEFSGKVCSYKEYAYQSMNHHRGKQLCFRGLMLGFDNTPRRMERAVVFHGADPDEYKKLMISLVDFTSRQPLEERLIFINAWNEWAEGNHIEPDVKFGDGYLKATQEAISINCFRNQTDER